PAISWASTSGRAPRPARRSRATRRSASSSASCSRGSRRSASGRSPTGTNGKRTPMEAMNDARWETLVAHATAGDREPLDELVRAVQQRVYALALRMLGNPDEAADATQEILIRVVTRLGSFRGEAAFPTWVHRVASNYLMTARARRAARPEMSFEALG